MRYRTSPTTILTTAALLAGAVAVTAGSAPAAPDRAGCTPTWRQVDVDYLKAQVSPYYETGWARVPPELTSVSVLPDGDVRASGGDDFLRRPYMMAFDGTSIRRADQQLSLPDGFDQQRVQPRAQSFSSADEGWTLVYQDNTSHGLQQNTYSARWHDNRWTDVPTAVSPDPLHQGTWLADVATVSATDAWSVGMRYKAEVGTPVRVLPSGTLIEHWDGTQWSIVDAPMSSEPESFLSAVTAISANDVWAVGRQPDDDDAGVVSQIQHWDGTSWRTVSAPAGSGAAALYSVSGTGPDDVWAVGAQTKPGTNMAIPLVMHWDGTGWTITEVPDVGNSRSHAVYAAAPDDVWVVGQFADGTEVYFLHWDGSSWQRVRPPGQAGAFHGTDTYYDIDGRGSRDIWAVGLNGSAANAPNPIAAHLTCERDR